MRDVLLSNYFVYKSAYILSDSLSASDCLPHRNNRPNIYPSRAVLPSTNDYCRWLNVRLPNRNLNRMDFRFLRRVQIQCWRKKSVPNFLSIIQIPFYAFFWRFFKLIGIQLYFCDFLIRGDHIIQRFFILFHNLR